MCYNFLPSVVHCKIIGLGGRALLIFLLGTMYLVQGDGGTWKLYKGRDVYTIYVSKFAYYLFG